MAKFEYSRLFVTQIHAVDEVLAHNGVLHMPQPDVIPSAAEFS